LIDVAMNGFGSQEIREFFDEATSGEDDTRLQIISTIFKTACINVFAPLTQSLHSVTSSGEWLVPPRCRSSEFHRFTSNHAMSLLGGRCAWSLLRPPRPGRASGDLRSLILPFGSESCREAQPWTIN